MTTIYSSNFDTETAGALPAGWVNRSGTWTLSATNAVAGLALTAAADGNTATYGGGSAVADMVFETRQVMRQVGTRWPWIGHMLRCDASNVNNYTLVSNGANTTGTGILLFKRIGGTYTQIGSATATYGFTLADGDVLTVRSKIVGGVVSVCYGKNGVMPADPQVTFPADTAVTGAGYPGLYYSLDGQSASTQIAVDEVVWSDSVATTTTNDAPAFSGTIPAINGTAGSAISNVNAAAYFSDSDALTYSASPSGTAWPSGLSINSSTGVISGTVGSAGTTSGIKVRATDTASQSVDSNAFDVVIAAAGAGPVQIAHNDAAVYWSPNTWDDRGTYKSANNPGAYLKMAFSGTSVAVKIDVSAMVAAGMVAGAYPMVRTVIDGVSAVDTQLTSGTATVSRTGLAAGSHTLELHFLCADIHRGERWATPVNAVRITGFTLDAGASLSAVAKRSKTSMHLADSIGEGYLALGTTTAEPQGSSSQVTIHPAIAQALDCEYGMICFSGQGYQQGGDGGVPPLPNAYNLHSAGRSRLVNGNFATQPDYIFIEHGTNGNTTSANVQAMIANLRAAAPNAKIFQMVPANGYARAAITAGVAAAADANTFLIDLGTDYQTGLTVFNSGTMYAIDGVHRNTLSNARVGAAFMNKIRAAMDGTTAPATSARTFSVQLDIADGVRAASLTGLKIRCYNPDGSLCYSTDSGTSDAGGVVTAVAQSTAAAGASCLMTVRNVDHNYSAFVQVS